MQHYLREISVAELLTREQEVELAQRIESGRAAMLAALCRSEVLRSAIKQWREGLAKNQLLLRDVVELSATRQRLKGDAEAPVDETGTSSALTQLEAELIPEVTAAFAKAVKVGKGRPKALAAALVDIVLQPSEVDRLAHRIKEASRRLMELEGSLVRLTQQAGVARQDFIDSYRAAQGAKAWLDAAKRRRVTAWRSLDRKSVV
jgi:RNA polymerase primary sigma factor